MKILCVDDDLTVRTILKSGLRKNCDEGDIIFVAESGEAALEVFNEHVIDVMITDLNMPGIDGMELLKRVKERNLNIESIVLTGHASINTAVDAMKFGARDYLEKPVNIPLLMEKLSNIREILKRTNEVEEYRHAKEIIEDNAGEDIVRLEMALSNTHTLIAKIKSLIESSDDESLKLNQIKSILKDL